MAPHPHEHGTGQPAPVSRRATRLTLAILIPAALMTVLGLILLWPGAKVAEPWTGPPHYDATVLSVTQRPCPAGETGPDPQAAATTARVCGDVIVRAEGGPAGGKQLRVDLPSGPGAPVLEAGDQVIIIATEVFDSPGELSYSILDHERSNALWAVLLAFALAVVAFGRWRGLMALGGLIITFGVLLLFVVPSILDGNAPLLVAITGSAAIMLVVLYMTHGISIPTSMAVLGTLASLTLTGVLATVVTSMLKLTGVGTEESSFLTIQFPGVNMLGLLLAGIVIGALGVLDDVTVTQAYTVAELAKANPQLGFTGLYSAASRVGRAHITSVINTIVLAYAGASLPLMLLLTAGGAPLLESLTSEWLTQEIVRSVVGTIGLIAAVPITTALAAFAAAHRDSDTAAPKRTRHRRQDPLEQAWDSASERGWPAQAGPPEAHDGQGKQVIWGQDGRR